MACISQYCKAVQWLLSLILINKATTPNQSNDQNFNYILTSGLKKIYILNNYPYLCCSRLDPYCRSSELKFMNFNFLYIYNIIYSLLYLSLIIQSLMSIFFSFVYLCSISSYLINFSPEENLYCGLKRQENKYKFTIINFYETHFLRIISTLKLTRPEVDFFLGMARLIFPPFLSLPSPAQNFYNIIICNIFRNIFHTLIMLTPFIDIG